MKHAVAALVLTTAIAATALGQSQEYNGTFHASRAQASDRLIVKWRSRLSESAAVARARRTGRLKGFSLERKHAIGDRLEVLQLERTLDAAELAQVVESLRTDPQIEFATPDLRRHIHLLPGDPLVIDQWYLLGTQPSATRTEQAWDTTTGAATTIVAVIDTGVRFEHPDLGRANDGGKLLPGHDFVSVPSVANDGDGWDTDPSDPGDWLTATDLQQSGFANCETTSSSWHGTRVAGIIGAGTNNAVGIAGGGWSTLILPVRALGKCGGFDSDIIAGMRWAAGLPVSGAPANPTPARIVNLSLGGDGACSPAYQEAVNELTGAGVLVIASAGNDGGPVSSPANCAGVLAVAGLRHAGTKVGFSNLGPEVGLGAPGGNCVNTVAGQPCLFSLVTTNNSGTTSPADSTYTDNVSFNVGTSFSAPLAASAAALMHSVNSRLGPSQVISLLKETAAAFPASSDPGVPTCRVPINAQDLQTSECSCTTQTCGAGMLNSSAAAIAAQRPFAVAEAPGILSPGGSVAIDGSDSVASNHRTIVSYQWSVLGVNGTTPSITDPTAASTSIQVAGNSQFTLRLTVTDDGGAQDTDDVAMATPEPPNVTPSSRPVAGSGGGGGEFDWPMLAALLLLNRLIATRGRLGSS